MSLPGYIYNAAARGALTIGGMHEFVRFSEQRSGNINSMALPSLKKMAGTGALLGAIQGGIRFLLEWKFGRSVTVQYDRYEKMQLPKTALYNVISRVGAVFALIYGARFMGTPIMQTPDLITLQLITSVVDLTMETAGFLSTFGIGKPS